MTDSERALAVSRAALATMVGIRRLVQIRDMELMRRPEPEK